MPRKSTARQVKTSRRTGPTTVKTGAAANPLQRVARALRPSHLKAYWLSRQGARKALKIGGTGALFILLVMLFFAKDLPSPNKINATVSAQTTRFYDHSGQTVLYEVHGDVNRTVIDFNQMPPSIKDATIAVEDKDFYKHGAFSWVGILRAAFVDLFHRNEGLQGGSTITQQYVKNALLSDDQSLTRKIKELILSIEIEQLYKKDDILKLYLNEIPYGTQAYGIQAASKTYFGKNAQDLTLSESAFLAAIPQAPSYYSPYGDHVDALIDRKNLILDLMAQQHYITSAQADAAKQVDVLAEIPKIPQTYANVTAPYFVKYVEAQLDDQLGNQTVDSGGLKVITTLDLTRQQEAETAVSKNMAGVRKLGGSNAALVAEDPKSGQVTAWVGGADFSTSQVDVANAERQPGSSFKPFVYSTLFGKKGSTTYGPGTTLYDVPTDFGGGYTPRNYCGCNYGVVSIRQALGNSLNVPAVKALYLAGVSQSIQTAHNLGITTLNADPGTYGLSLVLGSGEVKLSDMVAAYSGFATAGTHVPQVTVLKVTDASGKTLIDNTKPPTPKEVLDPQVAYEIDNILSDKNARALSFGANFTPLIVPGKTAAVKTGTTENYHDAWTVGFTQTTVAGVWAGNNDNSPMTAEAADVSAPIWHDFMVAATASEPNQPFSAPAGIKNVTLDAVTGRAPGNGTKQTRSDIFASWYNPIPATNSQSAQVDKVSGKLATSCTPPLAVETVYSNAIQAEIPASDPAFSRWNAPVQALAQRLGYAPGSSLPTDSDNVHSCSDTKPQINGFSVNGSGGSYNLSASWSSGTFPVNQLNFYFDDQIISTQAVASSGTYSFNYQPSSNGSHTFKVEAIDTGLYSTDATKTVNVSTTSTFNNLAPGDGASRSGGSINFSWTSDSGATKYRVFIKNNATNQTVSSNLTSGTTTAVNLGSGSYSWFVQAYDSSNNTLAETDSNDLTVI